MAKFNKDGTSRLFHLMMLVPAGLIFLLAIISLSTLADVNKEFRDEYDKLNPRGDATCILFAEDDSGLEFSDGDSCKFSIAGGGILAAVAVLYIVVLVVKAILGISVISILSMVELVISVLGCVWAFIVSVVITAGLDGTCKAYGEAYKEQNLDKFPCCSYYYGRSLDDEDNVFFYERVNASRITAWLAMVVLLALAVLYLCIILRYFCCGGRTGGGGGEKGTSSTATEKQMESM